MSAIEPAPRQRDVRVALTVHALLRDGFAQPRTVGHLLQVPESEAEEALEVAQRRGLLTWWRPDHEGARRLVTRWLTVTDRISSGDFADVTSYTAQGALQVPNVAALRRRLPRASAWAYLGSHGRRESHDGRHGPGLSHRRESGL